MTTLHRIKHGLDLPITGGPEQRLYDADQPSTVALLAADYHGLKPTMQVEVGDVVRLGQVLFEHRKIADVCFTSPAAGTVAAIERAEKRALQSVVIRLDNTRAEDQVELRAFTGQHPASYRPDEVRELLLESGLWTALRARPYGTVARPSDEPHSLFVTAFDSEPLAPDLDVVAEGRGDDFERGLRALAKLGPGPVYVCRRPGSQIAVPNDNDFRVEEFAGPHPSGTVGLHIHLLDPVDRHKVVWHIGLQDVLAIGRLFGTGNIDTRRIVALAGPAVRLPRLLRTRIGASTESLVHGELLDGERRVISGSVLSGRRAEGSVHGFLGRYDQQVSALPEDSRRRFLNWLAPGLDRFSTSSAFLSSLLPGKRFAFSTATQGDRRAIVPIGLYERIMPLDLMPSFLLKALVMGDVERAEELGALELEEPDLALCTYVCPSKLDFGPYLRDVLTTLESEG